MLKFRAASDDYWSSLVGESHLLGANSNQIYIVATGPGAVCCTNYWIVDTTSTDPHLIFRSEDFGDFRGPIEIADDNKDGIYELAQFDSCMRYFRDDCGSCSPEPRAYFAYDQKRKRYKPTKGIQQAFVKADFSDEEKSLETKHREFRQTKDIVVQNDLRHLLLGHIAELLHIGGDAKAWSYFTRFNDIVDAEDRREMKRRLSHCKFYKILHARK